MSYTDYELVGVQQISTAGPALDAEEIIAVSVGNADQMRALMRGAVGFMLGGALGGLIGMATGRRNTLFVVAATRDGFEFACTFATTGQDGHTLLTQIQRGRRDRGEAPMPTLEDLTQREAASAADEQLQLLRDIRQLLAEQTDLLRRIAGLRDPT
jgi:hypothetical protein